jgi:RNA polymerase sigma factor (sigma-70 family)
MNNMFVAVPEDAELVAQSLAGNRDAFGKIVSRYQSLICSLAYSATGNLGQSEDLAQETFITAWRHLRRLREQNKLRAWLCGIARNRINYSLRRGSHEPLRAAEPLEAAQELPSHDPLPRDQTISKEEEAILWRSLEHIPEIYREPLVLFYRKQQSIESVAVALELSEDAVKQRLSRGRKLLAEEVTAFVEGALQRTTPGNIFTVSVLASLPAILPGSAKAATLGVVAAKGTVAAKAAVGVGLFNALAGPLLGLVGPWLQYRYFLKAAQTDQERQTIKRYYRSLLALVIGFGVLLTAMIIFSGKLVRAHPLLFALVLISLVAGYVCAAMRMACWANGAFRKIHQERDARGAPDPAKPLCEYRSRLELLGLPLVHLRFNSSSVQRTPVKAWIAAGDFAFGLLFAFGGLAVAPVSIGGAALGLLSCGGASLGLFTVGGFALGGWTFGGFAIGWQAFGGCALGWNAAMGGLAVARDFAMGGMANAAQANNDLASQFIKENSFFQRMIILSRNIGWLNLLWLIPFLGWWRLLSKRSAGVNPHH